MGGDGPQRTAWQQLAIREGNWKLLMNPDRSRIELYDIPRDRLQVDNLAKQQPELVTQLAAKLLAWHQQLPDGPRESAAGMNDYPWPGAAATTVTPLNAKKTGKKAKE